MNVIDTVIEFAAQILELIFRVIRAAAEVYRVALGAAYDISPRTYFAFIIFSLGAVVALFVVLGELSKPVQAFFKPKPKDKAAPSSFSALLGCITQGFWLFLLTGVAIIFLFSYPFNDPKFEPTPTPTSRPTFTSTPPAPTSTPISTTDGDWTNPSSSNTPSPSATTSPTATPISESPPPNSSIILEEVKANVSQARSFVAPTPVPTIPTMTPVPTG